MEALALVISIIALIIAALAYHKVGGVADLKKQTEVLTSVGETVAKATDSLRDKTADVLDRMEAAVRGWRRKKKDRRPGQRRRVKRARNSQNTQRIDKRQGGVLPLTVFNLYRGGL